VGASGFGNQDSDIEMVSETPPMTTKAKKGTTRGRTTGRGAKAATSSRGGRTRGRNIVEEEEEEENESDENMKLDSDSESQSRLFVSNRPSKSAAPKKSASTSKASARGSKAASGSTRQSKLDFSQPAAATRASPRSSRTAARNAPVIEISDDDIEDDDDDAFEALPPKKITGKRR
jgi:hypothetical protein